MGRYTYTVGTAGDVTYVDRNGNTVTRHMEANSSFESDDACEMLRFISARNQSFSEERPGVYQDLVDACGAATATTPAPSPTPAQPGATADGNPGTQDSPTRQQAPTTSPDGRAGSQTTGPAPNDRRSPANQMADPNRPLTPGEVRDIRRAQGDSAAQADDAARRGARNEPLPGQRHPTHSGERSRNPAGGGDPVQLFPGLVSVSKVDLDLPTAHLPLQLRRTYLGGRPYFGPFGYGWDHSCNVYLRELSDGSVARWNGALQEDIFTSDGASFQPPRGVHQRLERLPGPGTRYVITAVEGLTWHFEIPSGWTHPERIPLVAIRDRHGNSQHYRYDTADRVARVEDDDGRALIFQYGGCGLLEAVEDHTGRRIEYHHAADIEQLMTVKLPADTAHPEGITTHYAYDRYADHPAMRHNLLRITDADGRTYLENEYDYDPTSWGFNRVCKQLLGDFCFGYQYETIQYVAPNPLFVDVATSRTMVTEPDGSLHTYTFNYRGDLIDYRHRLVADKSYRVVARRWSYDAAGNTTEEIEPDGSSRKLIYDHDNPDPCARGNLLRVELRAGPLTPAPSRIVMRALYEPKYQLIRQRVDEGGATTRYRYDLDLSPGPQATGRLQRVELPDATLPDGTVQQGHHSFENDPRGRRTAHVTAEGHRHEFTYATSGPGVGLLRERRFDVGGAQVVHSFDHDAVGRVAKQTDGVGAVTELHYSAVGNLERVVLPDVGGSVAEYRARYDGDGQAVTIQRPRGSYADAAMTGALLEDRIERTVLGHVRRVELGANSARPRAFTQMMDHRGLATRLVDPSQKEVRRRYDERGLMLSERAQGGDSTKSVSRRVYDRSGRLERILEGEAEDRVTRFEYGAFGRLAAVHLPNGSVERVAWTIGDLVATEQLEGDDGTGVVRLLAETRYEYDERGRVVHRIVTSFVDDPNTASDVAETFFYDGDDRLVRRIGPRGGITSYTYDGLGRLRVESGPEGNVRELRYDGEGRIIEQEDRDQEGGNVVARVWKRQYDARGRLRRTQEPDGTTMEVGYDDRDLPVTAIGPDGRERRRIFGLLGELAEELLDPSGLALRSRWSHDEVGRVVGYTDPAGEVTSYAFDGLGRRSHVGVAGGASTAWEMDDHGRIVRETFASGAELTYSYDAAGRMLTLAGSGPGVDPVGPHILSYDGADRLVAAAGAGAALTRRYDSQDRLVAETMHGVTIEAHYDDLAGTVDHVWPDGRRERSTVNHHGVIVRIDRTAAGALGAGPPYLAELTPAGMVRFGSATLVGGVVATASYDRRARLRDLSYLRAGAAVDRTSYRYDAHSRRRVASRTSPGGQSFLHHYDMRHRLVRSDTGFAEPALGPGDVQAEHDADIAAFEAASAGATRSLEWNYDDADARTLYRETGQPDRAYGYGAGHRMLTAGAESFSYSVDGTRSSDGSNSYDIDAMGRLIRVRDASNAVVLELAYDALGRISSWHQGSQTRQRSFFGAELRQESVAGAPWRQITPHPYFTVPLALHRPSSTCLLLHDGHLDLVAVMDHDGAVLERYRYDPFGAPLVLAPDGTVLGGTAIGIEPVFGAMPYAADAGLFVTRRRLYDPIHGVFLGPDPAGFRDSPNLYVFSAQRPVDGVDPDGELFWFVLGAIALGALIGGGANAVRQHIQIAEGSRREFSWGEMFTSAGIGGVLAPAVVFAPEVTVPVLTGLGTASAINQYSQGNYATGTFDLAMAWLPWGFKGVRTSVFGKGSAIGQARGLGPMDGAAARLSRFQWWNPGSRPPGVEVTRTTYEGIPAWQKTVSTRVPGLRWWAELTIRKQQEALQSLQESNVPAARVLQPYERGGALIIEDAGELASLTLRNNPSLRAEYNQYFAEAARGLGWPRIGRIPLLNRLFHDLKPDNIGYTRGIGFRAFDPAVDPVTVGVGTAGGLGIGFGIPYAFRQLIGTAYGQTPQPTPPGAATGPKPDK